MFYKRGFMHKLIYTINTIFLFMMGVTFFPISLFYMMHHYYEMNYINVFVGFMMFVFSLACLFSVPNVYDKIYEK